MFTELNEIRLLSTHNPKVAGSKPARREPHPWSPAHHGTSSMKLGVLAEVTYVVATGLFAAACSSSNTVPSGDSGTEASVVSEGGDGSSAPADCRG